MFRRSGLFKAPSFSAAALGINESTHKRLGEIIAANKSAAGGASTDRGIVNEVGHVARCNYELAKLFRWPEVRALLGESLTKSASLTSAEIIHLTAFSPSVTAHGRNDDHIHDVGCPIQSGELTLVTMTMGDSAPAKAPCQHCLRRRINFLASDHFAHGLYWNSVMPQQNASNHLNNQKVYQLVRDSFGTMRNLEDTVAEFAVNRRDAGFTWLVYNPVSTNTKSGSNVNKSGDENGENSDSVINGRLEVINLPGSTSPVVLGLWPVLCINLTTETIVDTLADAETAQQQSNNGTDGSTIHSWSRAARNPASAMTRNSKSPHAAINMTLSELRRAAATKQCKSLDLAFMQTQAQNAINYFSSPEFAQAAADRKHVLAMQAQMKVVKPFDNVELDAINNLKKKSSAAVAEQAAAAKAKAEADAKAKAAEEKAAKTAAAAASSSTAGASSPAENTTAAAAPATPVDENEIIQEGLCDDNVTRYATRRNGITTYSYANGTSTDVYPDGRQVAYTTDLTTTTYPDGTVHYLYANGATVEIRPDGTKYVNGELSE